MRDGDEITFKVHCIYWAKFAINRRTFFEHNEHKEFFSFLIAILNSLEKLKPAHLMRCTFISLFYSFNKSLPADWVFH